LSADFTWQVRKKLGFSVFCTRIATEVFPLNRLVVFDLDGTLNKTDEYGVEVYQKTLGQLGIHRFTPEEILQLPAQRLYFRKKHLHFF